MKTLEEKEKEFREYIMNRILSALRAHDTIDIKGVRLMAHNFIQDFKEEIEGFNQAMEEELSECKEQIERFREAFVSFKHKVEG